MVRFETWLSTPRVRMDRRVRIVKRTLDVVGASIGLALTAPLLLALAAIVKLDSRGPAIYWQRRAGALVGVDRRNGRPRCRFVEFEMPKFRTMRVDAEKATGPVLAQAGDSRVTRIGRILRRARLDELPQLWSVLRGEMSLVGPRPERPELLDNLSLAVPLFEERMRGVKPGITGFAQVNLGYDGSAPRGSAIEGLLETIVNPFRIEEAAGAQADGMRLKLLYDLAYGAAVDRLGTYLLIEAEIILRTPITMLRRTGR